MDDWYREHVARNAGAEVQETNFVLDTSDGDSWHDVHNELSPIRKHLIHKYLHIQDDQALSLLGEYFGVALSFMAMGALVRASNSNKKRRKSMSDEERLDLRACSRFQRMALESMLKEAMERLRGLAQNAYQLEEKVRDMVEAELAKDREKVNLLSRVAEAEKAVAELKELRKAEGKANERVMSIVAAKEQDWLKEKRSLQKEIERLKDNLNTVCREVRFQSRRCRNPTCEHCKGSDRAVRIVRGRATLRELNSKEVSSNGSTKREILKIEPLTSEEHQEERVLVKALEQRKKRIERPGHLHIQDKVEKSERPGNWTSPRNRVHSSGGSPVVQGTTNVPVASQQHDMETELANILKRVGALKSKATPGGGTIGDQQRSPQDVKSECMPSTTSDFLPTSSEKDVHLQIQSADVSAGFTSSADRNVVTVVDGTEIQISLNSGSESELTDLTNGLLSLEQSVLISGDDLLELEKAFLLERTSTSSKEQGGNGRSGYRSRSDGPAVAVDTQTVPASTNDEDSMYAEFETCLTLDSSLGTEQSVATDRVTDAAPSMFLGSMYAQGGTTDETTSRDGDYKALDSTCASSDVETSEKENSEHSGYVDGQAEMKGEDLAEEVKVVDDKDAEQVVEMVEGDGGCSWMERSPFHKVDESCADLVVPEVPEEPSTFRDDKSDATVEIPVFGRAGSEDLSGDLPEPDEKRVCESSEFDLEVVEAGAEGVPGCARKDVGKESSADGEVDAELDNGIFKGNADRTDSEKTSHDVLSDKLDDQ